MTEQRTSMVMTVTPALAESWLSKNDKNRRVIDSNVNAFAEVMKAGGWMLTHQGIAIAADGTLLDGQHRLLAVVKAGVAVEMRVFLNEPKEAIAAIDTGAARRAHDVLAISDDIHVSTACHAGVIVARRLANNLTTNSSGRITVEVLRDAIKWHRDDVQAVLAAIGRKNDAIAKAPIVGALAIAHTVVPEKVMAFIEGYRSGANLAERHPALVLRNYILTRYRSREGTTRDEAVCRTFSALEAFIAGEERHHVRAESGARDRFVAKWQEWASTPSPATGKVAP